MAQVLAALGHPGKHIQNHIHVAGTNGKGGVVRALEQALLQAGKRVCTYTSPYLWHFEENIRLNGHPIHSATCASLFARVWAARANRLAHVAEWMG